MPRTEFTTDAKQPQDAGVPIASKAELFAILRYVSRSRTSTSMIDACKRLSITDTSAWHDPRAEGNV